MSMEGMEAYKKRMEGEIVEIEGKRYRKVDTGYTIKQYFSHETVEKGPGPGWDFRHGMLKEMGIDSFRPETWPDTPYFKLTEIKNGPIV